MELDIFNAFLAGLLSVFSWPTFGYMALGIVIGFGVGILPGLGGGVALALMLPLTFTMQPVEAFAFLLGMVSVTSTTGDITSILFGVPGEAIAAATVVDGHPLAKQGQAGRALGAALMSSMVGAVIGAFAIVLAIPIVRPLVLSFGSPEFFMLTVLGLTFVAALSSGAMMKGLIAAAVGLLLSMVGLDPQTATPRYTFGILELWDGVGIVPLVLGIFAIPEIVDLAISRTSIAKVAPTKLGGVMRGVRDTFEHWWLVVRCSLIGTFLGIIPGLGAAVTPWIAYGHAVQTSGDSRRFGHGAIEGVLAPGAANNSTLGGTLIPTIAFGIPGGVTTAILLGAFIIQGIVPGPQLLTSNLPLTMSFVWLIVVSNIITVSASLLFIRQIARITFVRGSLLIVPIVLLVYVGAFAVRNSLADLAIVLLAGAVGLVMTRLDWPRPPLVLGLVLGGLAENYLFRSINLYGVEWVLRPGVLIMAILALSITFAPAIKKALGRDWPGRARTSP